MASSAKWPAGRQASGGHALRNCLGNFATGVAIVTYAAPDGPRGLTVNSFTSVSLEPPLVLVCLDRRSSAVARLPETAFAINILHAKQSDLARHFAGLGSSPVRLDWHDYDGVPFLGGCMARLFCAPWTSHDAGDHRIVVGRVIEFGAQAGRPLCFFRGEFRTLYPSHVPEFYEEATR